MKLIGFVAADGHAAVPVYNPGATPGKFPHIVLNEPITTRQLAAYATGVLNRPGGFLRIEVRKTLAAGKSKLAAR